MADNKWIHIENWMGKVLGLRANDLICFALIYSFSRDGESQFKGTLNYLAQCMFATEPTAISTLKKLLGVHLINKEDVVVNGKNRCYYSTNIIYDEGKIIVIDTTKEPLVMTTKEPLVVTTKESLVNNNSTINSPLINNNNESKSVSNDTQKVDSLFETFWKNYGYNRGKQETIRAWRKLKDKEKESAIKRIPEYKEDCRRNQRSMRYPATYLNKKTWNDDFEEKTEDSEDDIELPDGMTIENWIRCHNWLTWHTPRISGFITPKIYVKMKEMAKDRQVMTEIIRYIEDSGYRGDMVKEFARLLESGEYKEGE